MGATATGKSALAMRLALRFDGEIVSMDSRQVYRGFDVGTAKPPRPDLERIPHHLIDTLDPTAPSSAGTHAGEAARLAREIDARGRVPVLAGGTGLYFRALFRGLPPVVIPRAEQTRIRAMFSDRETDELYRDLQRLDAERARALSPRDRLRIARALEIIAYTGRPASEALRRREPDPGLAHLKVVLSMPRPQLREHIATRTRALFDAGWPDEVRRLLAAGVPPDCPAMQGLGYADIARALAAGRDPRGCIDAVIQSTRQYAKRQETFFRSESDALWEDVTEPGCGGRVERLAEAFLAAGRDASGPQ
jgi:tRNA dimethylallyltransferase